MIAYPLLPPICNDSMVFSGSPQELGVKYTRGIMVPPLHGLVCITVWFDKTELTENSRPFFFFYLNLCLNGAFAKYGGNRMPCGKVSYQP